MNARHRILWPILALILFSGLTAHAQFWGTWRGHNMVGNQGSWIIKYNGENDDGFNLQVGAGCGALIVETGTDGVGGTHTCNAGHRGYGDCALYIRYGSKPNLVSYTRRANGINECERIVIPNPPAGRYYIGIYGVKNYRTCLMVKTIRKPASSTWKSDLFNHINYERLVRGQSRLTYNSLLERAAQLHAQDMANYNYFSHTGRDGSTKEQRLRRQGYYPTYAGENIASGASWSSSTGYLPRTFLSVMYDYSPSDVKKCGWMNSALHKAAIVNPNFKNIGLGRAFNANSSGKYYFVANFGAR